MTVVNLEWVSCFLSRVDAGSDLAAHGTCVAIFYPDHFLLVPYPVSYF